MSGWVGVDLDGTLAKYDGWQGEEHIGDPIPAMAERVRRWVADGQEVRIFTARVALPETRFRCTRIIQDWLVEHGLPVLQITHEKDHGMLELWDDRAVQVEANTGRRMDGQPEPEGPP